MAITFFSSIRQDINRPAVSILLPVYNTATFLPQCLDSILSQTFKDFELLCINDGSTDHSLSILNEYKARDKRISIFSRERQTLGPARNKGLKMAEGTYLLFLDSDDFYDPKMLEEYVRQAEATDADIVLGKYRSYDTNTGEYGIEQGLDMDILREKPVFSRRTLPDHCQNITNPAVWNKFFKRSFLIKENLSFQELPNAEDVYFTFLSLSTADRISWVDKVLVNYRVGRKDNSESEKNKHPLCFIEAETALFDELHRRGIYREVERSYVNRAVQHCCYSIWKIASLSVGSYASEEVKTVKTALINDFFPRTKLLEYPDNYYYDLSQVSRLRNL